MLRDILKGLLLCCLLGAGQMVHAQVTFESVETATAPGSQQTLTINNPAGTAPGDLLLALIGIKSNDPDITAPAGSGWLDLFDHSGSNPDMAVFYKIADAADAAAVSFTFDRTQTGNNREMAGAILRYSGVDTTHPIDVWGTNTGNNNRPIAPNVTTTDDDTRVLRMFSQRNSNVDAINRPTGTTQRVYENYNDDITIGVFEEDTLQATPGATNALVFRDASRDRWVSATVALRPPLDPEDTLVLCANGIDDDFDGYIDAIDPGCDDVLPSFDCNDDASFLVQSREWNVLSMVTGGIVNGPNQHDLSNSINAIGYNVADDRIWGNNLSTRLTVTYEDANGDWISQTTPIIPGLTSTNAGDVDANGDFWYGARGQASGNNVDFYKVDINPSSPNYLTRASNFIINNLAGLADFAFHPTDGYAYAVRQDKDLVQLNLAGGTPSFTNLGPSGIVGGSTLGAGFMDADGYYYVGDNGSGDIYRVDLTAIPVEDNFDPSKTVTFIQGGPRSSVNDGARCVNAPVYLDAGDAPDDNGASYDYNTKIAENGPRHGLLGYDPVNHTADLMLGNRVDADPDGMPGANADSDDTTTNNNINDEDGVVFWVRRFPPTLYADVDVTNNTGQDANLCAWLDARQNRGADGRFQNNEGQCQSTSSSTATLTFSWDVPNDQAYTTYARFRITTDTLNTAQSSTPKTDGEVEDYIVSFSAVPTSVTIGSVVLSPVSVSDFLSSLSALGEQELLELLRGWDSESAAGLDAAGIDRIEEALRAYLDPDGDGQFALLSWETLAEQGTVGFYVERKTVDDRWVRISRELLPSLLSPLGGHYQMIDPQARSGERYQYRLLELDADGDTHNYGPYDVHIP